jgi:hypothetical protein
MILNLFIKLVICAVAFYFTTLVLFVIVERTAKEEPSEEDNSIYNFHKNN